MKDRQTFVNMEIEQEKCFGHSEREELGRFILKTLKDRHPKVVDSKDSITIDSGAGTKSMSLESLKEDYKRTKEWGMITRSLYCIPNWEDGNSEIEALVEKIIAKKKKLLGILSEEAAEEELQKDREVINQLVVLILRLLTSFTTIVRTN